jgi:hypothetical protein
LMVLFIVTHRDVALQFDRINHFALDAYDLRRCDEIKAAWAVPWLGVPGSCVPAVFHT